jgi:primase-polymerase (primpol)-like protein
LVYRCSGERNGKLETNEKKPRSDGMYPQTIRDNIPPEMASEVRWVARREDKHPVNPRTGEPADSTDPSSWGTLEEALSLYVKGVDAYGHTIAGVGFVLGDGYAGMDIDAAGSRKPASCILAPSGY